MMRQLQLWNAQGDEHGWSVRQSPRARRLSVRVFRHGGVEIVVPPRTSPARVSAFVSEHREWIERQRRRSAPPIQWPLPPPTLVLSALNEEWSCLPGVIGARVRVREEHDRAGGRLILDGDLAQRDRLRHALTRWLVDRALLRFEQPLAALAARMGASPERLQVRCQRTRWGSCSRRGTISLNACLLFQRPEVLRYLIVHELSHLKHMNHSTRFWAEVARHEPDWKALDRELLQGWRRVPSWIFK
ncbi:MAG TPA: SprT family zinc-dependent metalloprotease [Steroidobacteraceae bacterium]|nr:SprT family zinc-dependent metalloprotease [Steroidobacteraceae bacterium]